MKLALLNGRRCVPTTFWIPKRQLYCIFELWKVIREGFKQSSHGISAKFSTTNRWSVIRGGAEGSIRNWQKNLRFLEFLNRGAEYLVWWLLHIPSLKSPAGKNKKNTKLWEVKFSWLPFVLGLSASKGQMEIGLQKLLALFWWKVFWSTVDLTSKF